MYIRPIDQLRSLCNEFHKRISTLEDQKYDLEYYVKWKDHEVYYRLLLYTTTKALSDTWSAQLMQAFVLFHNQLSSIAHFLLFSLSLVWIIIIDIIYWPYISSFLINCRRSIFVSVLFPPIILLGASSSFHSIFIQHFYCERFDVDD